jgi:hypothetical protein
MEHRVPPRVQPIIQHPQPEGMFRANSEDGHRRLRAPVRSPGRGEKPPCLETPASARACELATLVLDCRAEGW